MPAEDNFVFAVELGSSKVVATAGRKDPDGSIHVLGYAEKDATPFISKGKIFNVDKMTNTIQMMREDMEKKLDKTISQVYVCHGGMGIHSVQHIVERNYSEQNKITDDVISSIVSENASSVKDNKEIIQVVQQEYKVGTQSLLDVIGVESDNLQGKFLNLICAPEIRRRIHDCFAKANLPIAGIELSTLQVSKLMLSDMEKQSGCVFVDMGAATTTVAVFSQNLLRHLVVLPLGGMNITKDLESLNISTAEAEELKLRYGIPQEDEIAEGETLTLRDGRTIEMERYYELVIARVEEILCNVAHQIEMSGSSKDNLIGGIIVTGRAANLKNIDKAIKEYTKFEKVSYVKIVKQNVRSGGHFNRNGEYNVVLSMIESATENCCGGSKDKGSGDIFQGKTVETPTADNSIEVPTEEKAPEVVEEEKPKKPNKVGGFFKKVSKVIGKIVNEDE